MERCQMTASRSDIAKPGEKWPWSIVPTRAFSDPNLKMPDLRVLGALCTFVNRAGVCWPALETVGDIVGGLSVKNVYDAVQRLKRAKYVRQLRPKDYQLTKKGWKTNRYQVLWVGDEPLPTFEEVKVAEGLRLALDPPEVSEEIGGPGDSQPLAHTLACAYSAAVNRALGQVRLAENEGGAARVLAAQGRTVDDVTAATLETCRDALARRAGVPSLADVARAKGWA